MSDLNVVVFQSSQGQHIGVQRHKELHKDTKELLQAVGMVVRNIATEGLLLPESESFKDVSKQVGVIAAKKMDMWTGIMFFFF